MGIEFGFLMMLSVLGGGGGGDLLDFTPTQAYWEFREQRVVAVATMSAVLADDDATSADKLMAIRTLGELGSADDADPADKANALKVLTPLVVSKEPFVGQYAKRSIAWVKGEDPESRKQPTSETLAGDLALLPHTSQIIGQMKVDNGVGPVDLMKLMPDMPGVPAQQKAEMLREYGSAVAQAAGMIGNARVDSVSLGATFFGQGDDGYAMIVARGQYDRTSVQLAFEEMAGEDNEDMNFYSIGDIEVIANNSQWEQFVIMMPSDEVFIIMFGEMNNAGGATFPVDETADLIENGDADLAFGAKVTKQLNQINREKADVWVAMEIPAVMKQHEMEQVFGPFDTGHAFAIKDGAGGFDVTWKAEGQDEKAIADSVVFMQEGITEGTAEMREMMQQSPEMRPMFETTVKMMESMRFKAEGKTMTGGMKLPDNFGMMWSSMFFGMRAAAPADFEGAAFDVEEAVEDVAE